MRVRLTTHARNDLAATLDYISGHSPQGALNVKRAVRRTILLIGQFPESGRRLGVLDMRVLAVGRYPYLIY